MQREDTDKITLGVLPNGSKGNVDAKYGIPNVLAGAQLVLGGRSRRMDLVTCEDLTTNVVTYSSCNVCYGFPVKVVKTMRRPGTFKVASFSEKMKIVSSGLGKYTAALVVPDGEVSGETRQELGQNFDCSLVAMFVGRLTVHGRFSHKDEAPFDSDKFQLMIGKASSRWKTISWSMEKLEQHAVSSCVLTPLPDSKKNDGQIGPDTVCIDGDVMCGTPCKVEVARAALRVFTA